MKLTRKMALSVLVFLLMLLIIGTQMPGAWRDEAFRVTQLPWQFTKVAHFVLFAAMACVARLQTLRWPLVWVVLAALGLALLTEWLQFFASNRNPTWSDIGIDLAGAIIGVLVAGFSRNTRLY